MKPCKVCGREFSLDQMVRNAKMRDGHENRCLFCKRAYGRKNALAARAKDIEHIRKRTRESVYRWRYSLTEEEYAIVKYKRNIIRSKHRWADTKLAWAIEMIRSGLKENTECMLVLVDGDAHAKTFSQPERPWCGKTIVIRWPSSMGTLKHIPGQISLMNVRRYSDGKLHLRKITTCPERWEWIYNRAESILEASQPKREQVGTD